MKKWILENKVRFFIIAGVLSMLIIGCLDYLLLKPDNISDVLVEAHGMLFDIILFGLVLTIYERITEKRDKIIRYKEEIEDYLGWEEKEASHRIMGNIRRLAKLGEHSLNLNFAFLKGVTLRGMNLSGSSLRCVNLEKANCGSAIFINAVIVNANLQEANFWDANFQWANLDGTDFSNSTMHGANFKGARLFNTVFKGEKFNGTDFTNARAFIHQRESFIHILSEEQFLQIKWTEEYGNGVAISSPLVPGEKCDARAKNGARCRNKPKSGHFMCHIHIKHIK